MNEKSAGFIIYTEGKQRKYLLLHYEEGHWDLPKGHIEKGETEKETALRELKEETGITGAQFVEGFAERLHYFFTLDKKTISKHVMFYLAKTKQKEIKLSFEHKAYKWLPFEEAVKQLTYKNAQEILKKAERFLKA